MPMLSFIAVGATCKKTKVEVSCLIFGQTMLLVKIHNADAYSIYYYNETFHTTCNHILHIILMFFFVLFQLLALVEKRFDIRFYWTSGVYHSCKYNTI